MGWAIASMCAIVFGLADSFRLFSHGEIDPRVPFSPVIFAVGVMALFTSAAVYELFPSRGAHPRKSCAQTQTLRPLSSR